MSLYRLYEYAIEILSLTNKLNYITPMYNMSVYVNDFATSNKFSRFQ